jgi:hypothetical protein
LTKDYVKISDDHLITGQSLKIPLVFRASVEKKLNQINVKKSTGPFDLPQKIIKRFSKELSFPLTDIINTFFREKCFGKCIIAVLFLKLNHAESENVRPIAI